MGDTEDLCKIMVDEGFVEPPRFTDSEGNPVSNVSPRNMLSALCARGGIFRFIERYLRCVATLDFDVEVFDEIYRDFEAYHVSDTVSFSSTIPLLNFSSDKECIEFADVATVVRLDRWELNRLASPMSPMIVSLDDKGLKTIRQLFASGFTIRMTCRLEKGEPFSDELWREEAQRILTSLRLAKHGQPLYNIGFSIETSGFDPVYAHPTMAWSGPLLPIGKMEPLHSSAQDTEVCKHIWHNLRQVACEPRQGGLDVALRKFNDIYNRRLLEDKIIDMAILLERDCCKETVEKVFYDYQQTVAPQKRS